MDKLLLLFQRKDGLTPQEFHRHYLDRHAPMATAWVRVLHRYVVNVTDQPEQPLDMLGHGHRDTLDIDAITEAWVDSVADFFDHRKGFADAQQSKAMADDHNSFIGTMHGYRVLEELIDDRYPKSATGRTAGVKLIAITEAIGDDPLAADLLDMRAPAAPSVPYRYVANRVIESITPDAPLIRHIVEISVPDPADLATVIALDAIRTLESSPVWTTSWYFVSEYVQRPGMRTAMSE